jgi:hypothetical protein
VSPAFAAPSITVTPSYSVANGGITWEVALTKDAVPDSAAVELPFVLNGVTPAFTTFMNSGADVTNGPANSTWYYNETSAGSGNLVWNTQGTAANETQNTGNNPFTGTITSGLQVDAANKRLFASLGSNTNLTSPVPTLHITTSDGVLSWTNAILAENGAQITVSGTKGSIIRGDMNGNGTRNFGDLAAFGEGLTNPAAYAAAFPGLDRVARGDMNVNGAFNFGDLTAFGTCLSGGACPANPGAGSGSGSGLVGGGGAVPEPSTLVLAGLAAISLIGVYRKK